MLKCFVVIFLLSSWYESAFSIHWSNIMLCVMSCVCLAGWLAGQLSVWQNFNIGHYVKAFQPVFFFICDIRIGTVDFHGLKPLSLTLTLAGGHKVSTEQYLLGSFSRTLFN